MFLNNNMMSSLPHLFVAISCRSKLISLDHLLHVMHDRNIIAPKLWTRMWSYYFMPYLKCLFDLCNVLPVLPPMFLLRTVLFNTDELNCMCILNCFHHLFACIIPSVILMQSPNSHRLMLLVCSLCDSKWILSHQSYWGGYSWGT